MTDYVARLKEIRQENRFLVTDSPEMGKAMQGLHGAAIKDGALDKKSKEMIALGIAVAIRCEGCILAHVDAALRFGATLEEIAEAVDVSILMGGGPSVMYGGKAIEVAKQFIAQAEK